MPLGVSGSVTSKLSESVACLRLGECVLVNEVDLTADVIVSSPRNVKSVVTVNQFVAERDSYEFSY